MNHSPPPAELVALYDSLVSAGHACTTLMWWEYGGRCGASWHVRTGGRYQPLYGHGADWPAVAEMMAAEWERKRSRT